jgi:GntR family transcriptional regulator
MPNGGKAEQVRRHVLHLVEAQLRPHDKLPTERELAGELAVSRLTIRRVLDNLERERRVYRVQGAGTFVREPHVAKSLELTSFTEDMRQRGMVPGSRLLTAERAPAGARISQELTLSPGDPVIHLARVRTADGEPICLEHSYIPEALAPGLLDLDLEGSLYELLSTHFRLHLEHAKQTITATVVDPEDARLLSVPAFSAAFRVERTGFDARGRPIERAESLYRSDRYHYELTLYRGE